MILKTFLECVNYLPSELNNKPVAWLFACDPLVSTFACFIMFFWFHLSFSTDIHWISGFPDILLYAYIAFGVSINFQAFVLKYILFHGESKDVTTMPHNQGLSALSKSQSFTSNDFSSLSEDVKAR